MQATEILKKVKEAKSVDEYLGYTIQEVGGWYLAVPNGWSGDGFVEDGLIYFDAGSETWKEAVKAGELEKEDAVAPVRIDLAALVEKYSQADRGVAELWRPLMGELK